MRIGILTFHRALNYGAFLQAYALKTYLSSLGHKVEIIDYWPIGHDDAYKIFRLTFFRQLNLFSKIKYLVNFALRFSRAYRRRVKMRTLLETYLDVYGKPAYTRPQDLTKIDVDLIFYGSDQIWWKSTISGYQGFDWAYWGDFVPDTVRKVSYAASMGVLAINNDDIPLIKKKLNNFSAISVRESTLQVCLENISDKKIHLVIDPVFLLSKSLWLDVMKQVPAPDNYVLLFNLMESDQACKIAKVKARELNCSILEITPYVKPRVFSSNVIQTTDALEFIYLINKAKFIVTSSFHGTAFSIIMQKQFYATGMKANSGRVQSLLNQLGLNHRLISYVEDIDNSMINYDSVEPLLNNFIDSSKSFLIRNSI